VKVGLRGPSPRKMLAARLCDYSAATWPPPFPLEFPCPIDCNATTGHRRRECARSDP
jgi:hypothetical protein